MERREYPGMFIALEGTDGCGKSTVLERVLKKWKDCDFLVTREPGGTRISEILRKLILSPEYKEMDARTEALLYAAARAQHVQEKILPALKEGKWVISDRFILSSLAYQGVGRGLGVDQVSAINLFATGGLLPDLTLYFDVTPEVTMERKTRQKSPDRLEGEGLAFQEEVYRGYQEALAQTDMNVVRIDASRPVEEVEEQVLRAITQYAQERKTK